MRLPSLSLPRPIISMQSFCSMVSCNTMGYGIRSIHTTGKEKHDSNLLNQTRRVGADYWEHISGHPRRRPSAPAYPARGWRAGGTERYRGRNRIAGRNFAARGDGQFFFHDLTHWLISGVARLRRIFFAAWWMSIMARGSRTPGLPDGDVDSG